MSLNCGIVGYGYMGQIRRRALEAHPECRVGALFHTGPANAGCPQVRHWQDMLRDPSLDAIFVCTPNFLTREIVVAALDHGKHVFAEKPPGISSAQVLDMAIAQRRAGRTLKFGFNHRYHPAVRKAKAIVESGEFGDILWMRGRYGKSVSPDFGSDWRAKRSLAGGGILMDQGIHMVDLFLHFCGAFEEAKAFASNLYWKGDVEDNVFAILRNRRGQVVQLHSTITQWRYLFSLEIFLSRGYAVVNGLLSKSGRYGPERVDYALNRTPAPAADHDEVHSITFGCDRSWDLEIAEFVDAAAGRSPVRVGSVRDALLLMRTIEMIYSDAGAAESRPGADAPGRAGAPACAGGTGEAQDGFCERLSA